MNATKLIRTLAFACTCVLPILAQGDDGNRQIELAATGRFDELQAILEKKASSSVLDLKDQHALCFAYSKTKRYGQLDHCLRQLGALASKTHNRRTRLFGLDDVTPAVHVMKADAAVDQGQYLDAIQEARAALSWIEKEDGDEDLHIQALSTLAVALAFDGNKNESRKTVAKLEARSSGLRGLLGSGSKTTFAFALAKAHMALGDYPQVIHALESDRLFKLNALLDDIVSGAAFRGTSNWLWIELPRNFMIHKARLETGRTAEAREGYDQLLKVPHVATNGEIHWLLLSDRGRIAETDGQSQQAVEFYRKAIDVIEQQRSSISTEANKIGFVGDKQAVYGRLITVLLRSGNTDLALEYIERAKARALVDLLATKEDFVVPVTAAKEASFALKSYRQAGLEALMQAPIDMSQGTGENRRNLVVTKKEELAVIAPELASLVSVSSASAKELQRLLHPAEAVVEFYSHGDELYAVTMTERGVRSAKLDNRGLEETVRTFREDIRGLLGTETMKTAQALYDRLLRPVESEIGGRSLLIIPHGPLHYLPFAALHDGKQFLIDSHALRYLPSASLLRYLKPQRTAAPNDILIFGNPDLGDARLDLPNAESEARMIAGLVGGSELLVRKKASESAFKQFAPSFHYLHFASHGEFNADKALASRLVLAKDEKDDGSLTVSELYSVRLDADLVTMSACETGLGQILNGDDVVGLTRGFLFAGSSNVVATLWQVDDLATSELMKRFYVLLKTGLKKRDALRQAQVDTRKQFSEPYFWAAFFITGSGQ